MPDPTTAGLPPSERLFALIDEAADRYEGASRQELAAGSRGDFATRLRSELDAWAAATDHYAGQEAAAKVLLRLLRCARLHFPQAVAIAFGEFVVGTELYERVEYLEDAVAELRAERATR